MAAFYQDKLAVLLFCGWVLSLGWVAAPAAAEPMNRTEIRTQLTAHLEHLSVKLGERSIYRPQSLKAAEDYVFAAFARLGYEPRRQSYTYMRTEVSNVIAGEPAPGGYYILGAHYDTVAGTPGADDNASGVAVLLEVARLTRGLKLPAPGPSSASPARSPGLLHPYMGSRVYAKQARKNQERILGMLCLEMVGYYRGEPDSQKLPLSLRLLGYPTTGDFLGLVSDWRSKPLLKRLEAAIKSGSRLPVVSVAVPLGGHVFLPEVRLSDHANFWDAGYPALMLTDTAFLRNPHYHGAGDVLANLDLAAMTELVLGLVEFLQREGNYPE